jgi:hypothetical protein
VPSRDPQLPRLPRCRETKGRSQGRRTLEGGEAHYSRLSSPPTPVISAANQPRMVIETIIRSSISQTPSRLLPITFEYWSVLAGTPLRP